MPGFTAGGLGGAGRRTPGVISKAALGGVQTSRWSTTDHYAGIFTTMGGLLFNSDPNQGAGHTIRGQKAASGRVYLEFTQATAANGAVCGIANPSFDLSTSPGADTAGNSVGYSSYNGGYYFGGGSPKSFNGYTQQTPVGVPIGMAVDSAAGLLWFFLAGQWWGAAGYGASVDPVARVGGIATPTGPLLPAAANGTGAGGYGLNTGGLPFSYSVPSGYLPWG